MIGMRRVNKYAHLNTYAKDDRRPVTHVDTAGKLQVAGPRHGNKNDVGRVVSGTKYFESLKVTVFSSAR